MSTQEPPHTPWLEDGQPVAQAVALLLQPYGAQFFTVGVAQTPEPLQT